jgi:hypothetical protein
MAARERGISPASTPIALSSVLFVLVAIGGVQTKAAVALNFSSFAQARLMPISAWAFSWQLTGVVLTPFRR